MKTKPITRTPVITAQQPTESTSKRQEQIRRRAYELFEQRGREDGHELDDWLQAKAEVTEQTARKAKVKAGKKAA